MEILTIDGTALPAPGAYKVQLSDLDSSGTGRTEDGVLVRERVRGGVAKISVSWEALTTAQCAAVLMYAGDRTADLKAARDGRAVWAASVHLIEF